MVNIAAQEGLLVQLASLESYPYLQVLTDNFENPNALGALLEFVSRPFVRTILLDWSQDSAHSNMLLDLSGFSIAHGKDLGQVYTHQPTIRANKKFPSVDDQYVGALLSTRTWPSRLAKLTVDGEVVDGLQLVEWMEKLKIFVLIQSMIAAEHGYVKERGTADLAKFIRVCIENIDTERATLLHRIHTSGTRFSIFLGNLQHQAHTRSDTSRNTNSPLIQKFLLTLSRVSNQLWTPFWKEDSVQSAFPAHHALIEKLQSSRDTRISSNSGRSLSLEIERSNDGPASIRGQDDHVVEDDGTAGPSKPFVAGQKAIFQNLEMSLMLPFSWHRPMEHERVALEKALTAAQSGNPMFRLGSTMTQLAILLSRSLHAITLIPLTGVPHADWSLDIIRGTLHRIPPRIEDGWRPSAEAEDWIQNMADIWTIKLQSQLASILKEAHRRNSKCKTLGDLWIKVGRGIAIDEWFRQFVATDEVLDRISTAMIAEIFPAQLHLSIADQASTALIASSPRTTLPAKCVYISQSAQQVLSTINDAAHGVEFAINANATSHSANDINAGGSRLFADLVKIKRELQRASAPLQCLSIDLTLSEWIHLHNLYTGFLVLSLLASTGSRPVNSPFESIDDFDFGKGYAFISDKYGGRGHNDRICVIGSIPLGWLRDGYRQYLAQLSEASISKTEGNQSFQSALREVLLSASGKPDRTLPLFFFLKSTADGIAWEEIAEENLRMALGLSWPLPMNAFRHILSTYLTNSELHSDIRDALMGHADRYAEPHGDFSMRIPCNDFELAKPAIDELLALMFDVDLIQGVPAWAPNWNAIEFATPAVKEYGRKARKTRRLAAQDAARDQAKEELETLTKDANLQSWSSDQWYSLGTKMLTRADGMPHSAGWLRYQVFEEFIRNAWKELGQLNRSHRALMRLPEAIPYFNASVINVKPRLSAIRASFHVLETTLNHPNSAPLLSGCMAAISLVLDCHLSSFELVKRMFFEPHDLKTVWYQNAYWLEWTINRDERWSPHRPVFRLQVSDTIVTYLNAARQSGKRNLKWPKAPGALAAWLEDIDSHFHVGSTLESAIRTLARWAEQHNNLSMPGVHSAYLAQRHISCALPHDFWVRAEGENPLQTRDDNSDANTGDATITALRESLISPLDSHESDATSSRSYEQALKLFRDVKTAIKTGELDRTGRQSKILTFVQKSPLARGNAARELAKYALYLASRPKLRGKGNLNQRTIERSWYNLEKGFLEFAVDTNLLGMDDEEVTELYAGIVEASADRGLEIDDPRNIDARRRASQELQYFHEFSADTLGIPDPDWAEFCEPSTWVRVRPGTCSVHDYQRTLNLLAGAGKTSDLSSTGLTASLVLLLCSRFGLRVGEALGLQRRDIYAQGGVIAIFVRPNSIRPIKTQNSKRVVPLIEQLSGAELAVLNEAIQRWERRSKRDTHHALFEGASATSFKTMRSRISGLISDALRLATGILKITTHHLRHAFAMRFIALIGNAPSSWREEPKREDVEHIQKLLLGTVGIDKRNLWAICRLLGHANPGVTILSYTHLLYIFIAKVHASSQSDAERSVVVDFDLDRAPRIPELEIRSFRSTTESQKTFQVRAFEFLTYARNVGAGMDDDVARDRAGLNHSEREYFNSQLNALMAQVIPSLKIAEATAKDFLGQLSATAWERMFEICKDFKNPASNLPFKGWRLLLNSRKELILHQTDHMLKLDFFLASCNLNSSHFQLIYHQESHTNFVEELKQCKVNVANANSLRPPRRLDRHSLPDGTIFKNRAVLACIGLPMTQLELCILWFLCWICQEQFS